jgi:flavin reductase (DIM6/NTAB) family NADH-FMN oxidoreductase RutF
MEPRSSQAFVKGSTWWQAPVTLVSCGVQRPNIWAVGVLGAPCDDPPILTVSPRVGMYSYRLMAETGQFVVNIPTARMVREMEYCGTNSGAEVDKWAACGFTPVKGSVVDVPLIAECPVNIECVIHQEVRFQREDGRPGEQVLVLGRIVQVHYHDAVFVNGHIQWDLIDPILRSRPQTWRTTGPVLGYDKRKGPLAKPDERADLVARRLETLESLAAAIRETPYPTQAAERSELEA